MSDNHIRGRLENTPQTFFSISLLLIREGLSVFFRGFSLMSSRAFIVNGVTFVAVEQLNKMCKNDIQR